MATANATSANAKCPARATELQQCAGERCRDHDGDRADHRELGVRLDQLLVRTDGGRHDGALRDRVGLAEHQHQERLGIEEQRVEVADHEEAQQGPQAHAGDDHPFAAARYPVERRADERCRHGEGGDREHEVEGDAPARRVEVEREEDRPRERDGEQRRRRRSPNAWVRASRANGRWRRAGSDRAEG